MSSAKKEAILDAAIKCISKYGIENTNSYSIAKELEIAQSGVYYHFPDQEALFDSLLERIARQNHELVENLQQKEKPKDKRSRLLTYIKGNLLWADKHPDQVGVLLFSFLKTSHSKKMKKHVAKTLSVGEDTIYGILATGSTSGDIRHLAKFIHQALIGSIISFHYLRPRVSYEDHFKILRERVLDLIK